MHSKATKITPLLLILLVSFSALVNSSISLTNGSGSNMTGITASHGPSSTAWISNGSSYAIYNGHWFNERYRSYPYSSNRTDIIMTAHMNVDNHTVGYSNLTIQAYEFFTNTIVPDVSGFWHQIDVVSGEVSDTNGHQPGLNGNQSFLFVPLAGTYSVSDKVLISSPFGSASVNFTVMSTTETVLGISTIKLAYYSSPTPDQETNVTLWISHDSGLLMRIIGRQWQQFAYWNAGIWVTERYSMDMSMEIGETNIESLVFPTPPANAVPWISAGKYIQYNLEGSGSISAGLTDRIHGISLIPGFTTFRSLVSANITMKIERGTTAYVDPWYSTRYIWVVHLMLNNTQILLPDFRDTIDLLNATFGMPKEIGDQALAMLSPFNHTGLVAQAWLLVDQETGIMLMPGMHIGALEMYSPGSEAMLGDWLAQGYGLQVLSWFAQGMLHEGWSIAPPGNPMTVDLTEGAYSFYLSQSRHISLDASIACTGTEYLTFPGGGGGDCWRLDSNLDFNMIAHATFNRTMVTGFNPMYIAFNSTTTMVSRGYIDIERTSGFPLAFGQQFTLTFDSETNLSPDWWIGTHVGIGLQLKAYIPQTNIWFSNPPVLLSLGTDNTSRTPSDYFHKYGFDVWADGAGNVSVTSSASQPPGTDAPPASKLPLVYLGVEGTKIPGYSQVMLHVFYNRTRCTQLGIDEDSLKLYVWNGTLNNWQPLASTHIALNSTHGVILAVLPHFSYFAVFGAQAQGAGLPGISSLYIIIAAVAVIGILAAVVYVRRKKGVSKAALKIQ
ncbi:MAG: hypothetical protein WED05_07250 [Candidatus Atabeyarchaeum deiterrae]